MKQVAVLTPSFAPDFRSFERLHNSVLAFTDDQIIHHVIVPQRDLRTFRSIRSPRLVVWAERDFLPMGMLATDRLAALGRHIPVLPPTFNCSAINIRSPWPPVRGWVLQQILKLSAATQLECDAVIVIDSDVVFVRPMTEGTFFKGHVVRTYEKPHAISSALPRHLLWTRAAYDMLGIPWPGGLDFPDYVGGIVSWDPKVVSACLARVAEVSGTHWATAVAKNLHISEFVLYGTYLRHFGTKEERSFCEPDTLCHSYWRPSPLSPHEAQEFARAIGERDIALHIQSNSETVDEVVQSALSVLVNRDTK